MNEARPGMGGAGGQGGMGQQPQGLGGRIGPAVGQQGVRPVAAAAPVAKPKVEEVELESIALEEIDEAPAPAPAGDGKPRADGFPEAKSKIHAFSVGSTMYGQENFKRVPNINKTGAVRVRSFHGRLSDSGLDYLDHSINDWLEKHPEIEVKFVTSTTGMYDGKIKEPALILNLWY